MKTKKSVWKYDVSITDYFVVVMPVDSEILHFGLQDGLPMLWVLVDPSKDLMRRKFRLAGTGHDIIEDELTYIGTVKMINDTTIFHLFEI